MPDFSLTRLTVSATLQRLATGKYFSSLNRALLALWAILACASVWAIFSAYPDPTGEPLSFTLTSVSKAANVSEKHTSIKMAGISKSVPPGRYALEFNSPPASLNGAVTILLGNKNVRNPSASSGAFEQVATGFVWKTTALMGPQVIFVDTIGVTKLTLTGLTETQGEAVTHASYALSALFIGGLAMLTLYSCIVALVAREKLFGHYAAWLFSTLAFGSITAGYDLLWIPSAKSFWLEQGMRQLICATWAATTTSLFLAVFQHSISWLRIKQVLQALQWAWGGFCLIALFTPSDIFMPAYWATCLVCLLALTLGSAHVWVQSASSISSWYCAGWVIQLSALAYEMASIAGVVPRQTTSPLIPAGAAAALFVGVALAEMLRSERQEKQLALDSAKESRSKLADFYDSSPAGLLSYDRGTGALLSINKAASEHLACGATPPALAELFATSKRSALDANERVMTRAAKSAADPIQHLSLRFRETDTSTEVAVIDNTADFNLQSILKQQATTDPLSGLKNRRALYQDLHLAFHSRHDTDLAPTLLMLDLYRFADINNYFGQNVGDGVLKEVGCRLIRCGFSGNAYRLAADNFALLIVGTQESATHEANKIQEAMTALPFSIGRRSIPVKTRSVGAALSSFHDADEATSGLRYLAQIVKRENGSIKVFGNGDTALHNWQIERRFAGMLKTEHWSDNITLFAQPLVSLKNDGHARYEMLMRVRNGAKLDPPTSFLQAAESIGMMPEVDLHVVEKTLLWLEQFDQPPLYVTANLSGASLADPNFITQVSILLEKHSDLASHLCLEVTESVAVSDLGRAAQFFNDLRKFGVMIALDDFGQGYTNFRNLAALPVQIIKLDGSIVRDVLRSPRHAAIIRCLTDLSHSLGMRCVAEWVEDRETADQLAAMNVDIAQGWYFAKAMPLEHWAIEPFPVYAAAVEVGE